jgi:hypothetical protein
MTLRITLAISIAMLSGCASIPSNAPAFSLAPVAPDGYATVYFYRVGAFPTLRKPTVTIDKVEVYEPPEKAYTWVYVKAAERNFLTEWAWDTKWPPIEFKQNLVAGVSYFYKISGSFEDKGTTGYRTRTYILGSSTQRVLKDSALAELALCCRYIKASVTEIP